MRQLLITGARVLDPQGELHRPPVLDVLVADGRVAALGGAARDGAGDAAMLDASGCLLTPGLVNAHSHSHDTLLRGRFEGLPLDVWGLSAFPSGWPRRTAAEVGLRARLHAAECLLGGMTTVQDMVSIVGPDREHVAAVLDAYRESGIRTVLALQFADRPLRDTLPFPDLAVDLAQGRSDPAPMQRLVEAMLDTGHHPRLSWGLAPSAPQRCSEALLRWVADLAQRRGLPVFTHLYETRSQAVHARLHYGDEGGSLVSFMARLGLLGPRLVVAHGVWIGAEEIGAIGAAGAHLACNPAANLKLLNGVAPVRAYAMSGAGVALGCDNSSAGDAQSMFSAMKLFALAWAAQSPAGEDGAAANAFRAATLGGAAALGLEGVGRIQPGSRADLVLFDLASPAWWPLNSAVRQLVYAETGRAIRHVLVGGDIVVRDGRLTTMDEAALAAAAEQARVRMDAELEEMAARDAGLRGMLLEQHRQAAAFPLPFDRMSLN